MTITTNVTAAKAGLTGASALVELFRAGGYTLTEPAVLQPVEAFLEVSGEDIRKRLFVTLDADSRDWCLRPEFTIPVCRDHLTGAHATEAASYAYLGPVFRMRAGEKGEFLQAGVESIGRVDREAADAEVISLACDAAAIGGLDAPDILIGDVAVLQGFVKSLGLPATAARRLMRAVSAGQGVAAAQTLKDEARPVSMSHAGLLAAIEGQDPKAARRFVEDVLSIAGISRVGGRSAGDIASRFLDRASEKSQNISEEAVAAVAACLAVEGDPDACAARLRRLTADVGVNLAPELDAFEARIGFMAARGLDVARMRFSASFARNLDYYTSFIFELRSPDPAQPKPAAGGGRYDTLMRRLGASANMPAVGFSLWLDRLPRNLVATKLAGGAP